MRFKVMQHSFILFISLLLGFLGFVQYRSVFHKDDLFEEQNPFRELRIMLEGNKEMKTTISSLQEQVQTLSSQEGIQKTALKNVEEAKVFSGDALEENANSLNVTIENSSLETLIRMTNVFWNAGVKNMKLNGIMISAGQAGFDQAGGQILLGSTPMTAPYVFSLYGDTNTLAKILNPESGALKQFQTNDNHITLSVDSK